MTASKHLLAGLHLVCMKPLDDGKIGVTYVSVVHIWSSRRSLSAITLSTTRIG
jgi:hypothetical protein